MTALRPARGREKQEWPALIGEEEGEQTPARWLSASGS